MGIAGGAALRAGRGTGLLVSVAVLALLGGSASATTVYQLDDGTIEGDFGYDSGNTLVANGFTVAPGGERITAIQVGFRHVSYPAGKSFTVLLYQGADGSGDPTNGVTLLASAVAVVADTPDNVFQTVDIPDTVVTGRFFAGLFETEPNGVPAATDDDSSLGQSWWVNTHSVSDPAFPPSWRNLDTSGGGNFAIRAVGESLDGVVPEPMTMLALAAGVGGVAGYLRRRSKPAA